MTKVQESYWAVVFTGLLALAAWMGVQLLGALFRRLMSRPFSASSSVPSKQHSRVPETLQFRPKILSLLLIGCAFTSFLVLTAPALIALKSLLHGEGHEGPLQVLAIFLGVIGLGLATLLHSIYRGDLDWDRE